MRTLPILKKGDTVLLTCRSRNGKTGVVNDQKIKARIFTVKQNGRNVEFSYVGIQKILGVYEGLFGNCVWKTGEQRNQGIIELEVLNV